MLIGAGYFVWTLHPLGLGEARAVEHELRDNLTNHAEYFGEPKPTSVSCEKFGTLVRPPSERGGQDLGLPPEQPSHDGA